MRRTRDWTDYNPVIIGPGSWGGGSGDFGGSVGGFLGGGGSSGSW